MPNGHAPGLLGKNIFTGDGLHLHHAVLPPVVVHSEADAEKYREKGYQEDYLFQQYPKAIVIGTDKDGNAVTKTAKNKDEEAVIVAAVVPGNALAVEVKA